MLNKSLFLPLYSWGMGTALIIIFAIVCLALVLIVLNLMKTDKTKEDARKESESDS